MKYFIVSVILLALLCGCDLQGIQQGWIYAKHYYPAYTSYSAGYYTRDCTGTGEDRECTEEYHSGHFIYHDAEYSLDISSCRHNVTNSECKDNTLYVDQHDYDSYQVGQYYGSQ